MSALEVVSFLGKLLCAVAALKAALYLLRRVCLAMAWKSGGASHSELIHNLRSESRGGGAGRRGPGCRGGSLGAGGAVTGRPVPVSTARPAADCHGERHRRPAAGPCCPSVRPSVSACARLCVRTGVCPASPVPGLGVCPGGGGVAGRAGCCCGRRCGGRGGADGGPGGEGSALAVPCSPRPPLAGPVPAGSAPSALCEPRRGRRAVISRTPRDRRPPGSAPGWRAAGPAGGVGGRPPLFEARAEQRRGSRPRLGIAPERPRVFVLCGRGVRQPSLRPPPPPGGVRSAPLRGPGWGRGDRTGQNRSCRAAEPRCDSPALPAQLCGARPALGAPCARPGLVLSPC